MKVLIIAADADLATALARRETCLRGFESDFRSKFQASENEQFTLCSQQRKLDRNSINLKTDSIWRALGDDLRTFLLNPGETISELCDAP
jgi:hypothetical protein